MKKNVILIGVAITLFILSCVFFSRAYRQMRWHSSMTDRTIEVYSVYQKLSVQINNAAITFPEFNDKKKWRNNLFFVDSVSLVRQLELLQNLVRDSVNIRIASALNQKVRKELSWILASNVPDSIVNHRQSTHTKAFKKIDSLITLGINRTNFLFQYRKEKLEASLNEIQAQILVFMISASVLLVYITVNLLRQYKKRLRKEVYLEVQEKKFRALVENSHDIIVMLDGNYKSIYRSPSAEKITGFNDEERKTLDNVDQIHVDDRERVREYLNTVKTHPGMVIAASYRIRHKLGHYIWLEGTLTSLLQDPAVRAIIVNMRDVSRHMTDELELQTREKRFRDTLENMMEGVQIIDFNWQYIYVNDALIKYSTYSKEAMVGQSVMDLYPGVEQSELYKALQACMQQRQTRQLESEFTFPDGTKRFFDLRIQPVPEGIFILSIDITERKKGEEEVIKLNRLYAFISSINQSIVHITNIRELAGKACEVATDIGGFQLAWIEMINEKDERRIIGISGETGGVQAIKRNEGLDYNQPPFCYTPVGIALSTGNYSVNNHLQQDQKLSQLHEGFITHNMHSSISLPIRVFGKTAGIFNLTSSIPGLFDTREIALLEEAAGDISFALENFEKARIHKSTQELVVANERRFRALLEKSTDMKTLTNEQGLFVYASPSVLSTFGYLESEVLGRPSFEFFHPDDRPGLLRKRNEILNTPGDYFLFQYRILHKAGHWIWCEGTLTNLMEEPDVNAMVSNFRDISERKDLEEQKEFDARNLSALINNTNDLLWSIDTGFNLITFNRPFFENIKAFSGKVLKTGDNVFTSVLSEEQRARFTEFYNRAFAGESFTAIDTIEFPVEYVSEISFYPIRHGRQIIGTACHSRDITQRRHAERERELMVSDLMQYTKNLEQFTFVVSHNLRAPIAHILGLSAVLRGNLTSDDRGRTEDYLFKAVNQLDTVINDLNKILEIRSAKGLNKEEIDFSNILADVKNSLSGAIEQANMSIEENLEVTRIFAFKSYMYSVLLNLMDNAIKYRRTDIPSKIRISTKLNNNTIELSVSDNGIGMDLSQYGDKVFGMYQRFNLSASGKGLGLFMVKTEVEAMNGKISVTSDQARGTEFIIELPAHSVDIN